MEDIICPHCVKKLSDKDIAFETIRPGAELYPDDRKHKYLRQYSPIADDDISAMTRDFQYFSPGKNSEFTVAPNGTPIEWNEKFEGNVYKSTRRICGECHLPLPFNAGIQPMVLIGFVGNTSAGKTVYLLSLIRDLTFKIVGLGVSPDPAYFSENNNPYFKMYQEMYTGNEKQQFLLPSATDKNIRLMPIVLNCTYRGRSFMIVLFDMAGEGSKDEFYMAIHAKHLEMADGVIYLKDPEYLPILGKRTDTLAEHQYFNAVMQKLNKRARVAITMTKMDLLEQMNDSTFRRIMTDRFGKETVSPHANGYKRSDAMFMDINMRQLYSEPSYRDQIILNYRSAYQGEDTPERPGKKRLFSKKPKPAPGGKPAGRIMLMGASALGCDAQVLKDEATNRNYVRICPSGVRNVDPVAWILYEKKLIPAASE